MCARGPQHLAVYDSAMGREVVVGVTGASGAIYAVRLLSALERAPDVSTIHLLVTGHARIALREELDLPCEGPLDLKRLLGVEPAKVRLHPLDAVGACIASGSWPTAGMVVIPCSMGTAAKIAHGISDSLLTRAADVCLKERRKLILAVRETPLSTIHLRNLLAASEAGALILPAMPAFYSKPASIEAMVDHYLGRVLDHLGLDHRLSRRWQGGSGGGSGDGRDLPSLAD